MKKTPDGVMDVIEARPEDMFFMIITLGRNDDYFISNLEFWGHNVLINRPKGKPSAYIENNAILMLKEEGLIDENLNRTNKLISAYWDTDFHENAEIIKAELEKSQPGIQWSVAKRPTD